MDDAEKKNAGVFLQWLFSSALEDGNKMVMWCHPSKHTTVHETIDGLVSAAEIQDNAGQNVYVSLGFFKTAPLAGRGTFKDVSGIVSLWADIDYGVAGENHKKTNLPPDYKSAMKVYDNVGLEPSVIVHSGHGFQVYWLLKEPWNFETDKDRIEGQRLAKLWGTTCVACARQHNWQIDSVSDITRVFRVPGTTNKKTIPHMPVTIVFPSFGEPKRYNPCDFEPYLVAEEFVSDDYLRLQPKIELIDLNPNAGIPEEIPAFIENDGRFKRTWNKTRIDLRDSSPSGYDFAVANALVRVGLSDQKIANAIFAWRAKHGEDTKKALRRDYLMRTIGKARASFEKETALDNVPQLPEQSDAQPEERNLAKEKIIERLSAQLRIRIKRIIRYGRENSSFAMILSNGKRVILGTTDELIGQKKARKNIVEATDIMIQHFKNEIWNKVVELIFQTADFEESIEDCNQEMTREWLRKYLEDGGNNVFKGEEWVQALKNEDPFFKDGNVYIHTAAFYRFVRHGLQMHDYTRGEIGKLLWTLNFKSISMTAKIDGKPVCRTYRHTRKEELFAE